QLHADEAEVAGGMAEEVAGAAARLQDGGPVRDPEAVQRGKHGADNDWGSVEGIERGPLGARVFVGIEQALQFLAKGLPGSVLVLTRNRIGEDREGDGPEPTVAGEGLPFVRSGRAVFLFELLQDPDRGEDFPGLGLLAARKRRRS